MKKLFLIVTLSTWGFQTVSAQNTPVIGTVLARQSKNVLSGGFTNSTQFQIGNTGQVPLQFFMASSASGQYGGIGGVSIGAGQQVKITIAQLGGIIAGQNLNVFNNSNSPIPGAFVVLRLIGLEQIPVVCDEYIVVQSPLGSGITKNPDPVTWVPNPGFTYICPVGNVGIGTHNPQKRLDVVGDAAFSSALSVGGKLTAGNTSLGGLTVTGGNFKLDASGNVTTSGSLTVGSGVNSFNPAMDVTGIARFGTGDNGNYIRIGSGGPFSTNCELETKTGGLLINFESGNGLVMGGNVFTFGSLSVGNGNFNVDASGNVGIGQATSSTYKLQVNGSIHTKLLQVDLLGWSDFVFDKNYKLRSLKELETYIKANHHLPEVPAANEVAGNGANVGELLNKQMQKIEELTLYILQQQKEIDALKAAQEKK